MSVEPDTTLGPGQACFPPTAWSLINRLRDPKDPSVRQYLDRMIRAYWRPIYKYLRIKWKRSNEDAKDLVQAFFLHVLEGGLLGRADRERGNFRSLLLASLNNFMCNEVRAAETLKRGGGRRLLSLDAEEVDPTWAADPTDPEAEFEAQWAREVLEKSIERLQEAVRPEVFLAFRRFHLEGVPVGRIALELGRPETQVAHHLRDARAALRRIVTDAVREYVQDESEIPRELDLLFRGWR